MNEENLGLFSAEELPQTDEGPTEKPRINFVQENMLYLIDKNKVSLADIQKATLIPWGTLYSWYKGDVRAQMLDINVKEIANYFEVSIDSLAFDDMKKMDEQNCKYQ